MPADGGDSVTGSFVFYSFVALGPPSPLGGLECLQVEVLQLRLATQSPGTSNTAFIALRVECFVRG